MVKYLINEKWHTFQCRNSVVCHHLKQRLWTEICIAKMFSPAKTKASRKNLWNFVNSILSKKTSKVFDIVRQLARSLKKWGKFSCPAQWAHQKWLPNMGCQVMALTWLLLRDRKRERERSVCCYGSSIFTSSVRFILFQIRYRPYSFLADLIAGSLGPIFSSSLKLEFFTDAWKFCVITPKPKSYPVKINILQLYER